MPQPNNAPDPRPAPRTRDPSYEPAGRVGRPPRGDLYERLDVQIGELRDRLGGLPSPLEAQGIWRDIWVQEAHHSTAIEGNTLVLRQVEQLLQEGRAVGNKELREYMEVQGYANAAEWVYGQGIEPGSWSTTRLVALGELRKVHELAMGPVWDVAPHPSATPAEAPGSFRQHDIEPFPGGMQPPTFPLVHSEIDSWLQAVNRLVKLDAAEIPEAIAEVHGHFERIHPFLDGNGRTGRLVLNLILVRMGYPPAIIYKGDRTRYLAALRRADQGDCGALGEFLARAVLDNLYKFIVPAVAGPNRLVPLPVLATKAISRDALRVAAARGRLKATKGGDGTWRSSRVWVDEYLEAKSSKGRKPSVATTA